MLKIPGVYVAFRGDMTELKRDFKKVRELAKQSGTDISNGMKNAVVPSAVARSMDKLYQNLSKINRGSAVTKLEMKKLGVAIGPELLRNVNMSEREFHKWQRRILNTKAEQTAARAIRSLGRAANLTTIEMALLRRKVGDTKGALRGLATAAKSSLGKIAAIGTGIVVAFTAAAYAIGRSSKAIWDSGREAKVAANAYKEITGSVAAADAEMNFLHQTADKLGLNFYVLREGYMGFLAAAKDSTLPIEEVRRAFSAVSNATAVLGLSNEKVKLTFLALEQMLSKGVVSMQELRRQMGDNLYGSFQKAARAMGLTTAELDKLVSSGNLISTDFIPKFTRIMEQDYIGTIDKSVRATNKFDEAWEALKVQMSESGFMDSATTALKDLTEVMKDPQVVAGFSAMAKGMGKLLEYSAKMAKMFASDKDPISRMKKRIRAATQFGMPFGEQVQFKHIKMLQAELAILIANKAEVDELHAALTETGIALGDDLKKASEESAKGLKVLKVADTWFEDYQLGSWAINSQNAMFNMRLEVDNAVKSLEKLQSKSTWFADYQKEVGAMNSMNAMDSMRDDVSKSVAGAKDAQRDTWVQNGIESMDAMRYAVSQAVVGVEELESAGVSAADEWKDAFTGWASGFSASLNDMVWNADASFKDIATSFAKMITQMVIQQAVVKPFMGFMGGLFSAKGNAFTSAGVAAYAHGGTFTNSIVDKPTMFAHGGGFGIMGEAGAEAILPLTRTSDGDLGVKSEGSSPNVKIEVINNGEPAQVTQKQPRWDGKQYVIGVVLDAMNNNTGGFKNNMKGMMA